ncbi:hypothetical protein HK405_005815 [Cladochytrium tenue]|nr:hypothetical protein HK405_005815 [Cladochytrium tenue]
MGSDPATTDAAPSVEASTEFVDALRGTALRADSTVADAAAVIADRWMKSQRLRAIADLLADAQAERQKLAAELADKEVKLAKATQRILQIESSASFLTGLKDDMEAAVRVAGDDWPIALKDYKYDIFISYRVKSESILANELYLSLQIFPKLNDLDVKVNCVQTDNVLLEWETALLAADQKKCTVLPSENEHPFNFDTLEKELATGVYPDERPEIADKTQCYLSAATTLRKLLKTPGIFLRNRGQLRELLPKISQKLDQFMAEDKSSFTKATYLYGKLPTSDEWEDSKVKFGRLSLNQFQVLCQEVLPYNGTWKEVALSDISIGDLQVQQLTLGIETAKSLEVTRVEELNFVDCPFQVTRSELISTLVATADGTPLDILKLERTRLGVNELKMLFESIKGVKGISCLKIIDNSSIGDAGVQLLCDALSQHDEYKISSLWLSDIGMENSSDGDDSIFKVLCEMLRDNPNLTSVALPNNEISELDAGFFGDFIKHNTAMKILDLNSNSIGSSARNIFLALSVNSTLQEVNLSDNQLNDDVGDAIGEAIKRNNNLKVLLLNGNSLSTSLSTIFEGLTANTSLERLELNSNSCGIDAAKVLADSLRKNHTLQYLGLDETGLVDTAVTEIAKSLLDNNSLSTLDIERNQFGNEGAIALAATLKTNTSLKELCLAGGSEDQQRGKIGLEGAKALATALEVNVTLEKLTLGSQGFGAAGALQISAALAKNKSARVSLIDTLLVSADTTDVHTQLHIAVKENYQPVVEKLLQDEGIKINTKNGDGDTALHVAISCGSNGIVRLLLQSKANVEIANNNGDRPLHLAVDHSCKAAKSNETTADKSAATGGSAIPDVVASVATAAAASKAPTATAESRTNKRLEVILMLLEMSNANIDSTDGQGNTPLHVAIKNTDLEIVKLFVERKASLSGYEPMHLAIKNGATKELVQYLLDNKANINAVESKDHQTPLMVAAADGQDDVVQLLCQRGADKDAIDGLGRTALALAIAEKKESTARLLLDEGVSANGGTAEGSKLSAPVGVALKMKVSTPLGAALKICEDAADEDMEKILGMIRLLVKSGADVNKLSDGERPLVLAARYGSIAVVQELLSHGAYPDGELKVEQSVETDPDGTLLDAPLSDSRPTPLFEAVNRTCHDEGGMEIVKLLLSTEVDLTKRAELSEEQPVEVTVLTLAAGNGGVELVELLLQHGAHPDDGATDSANVTPLVRAMYSYDDELSEKNIRLLLKHGANPNKPVSGDRSIELRPGLPLSHLVMQNKSEELVGEILDLGADVNGVNGDEAGTFALLLAAKDGRDLLVKVLLERGATVNQATTTGETALHKACQITDEEEGEKVRQLLLSHGADVHAVDTAGNTAMHLAAKAGLKAVVSALGKLGLDVEAKNADGKSSKELLREATDSGNEAEGDDKESEKGEDKAGSDADKPAEADGGQDAVVPSTPEEAGGDVQPSNDSNESGGGKN